MPLKGGRIDFFFEVVDCWSSSWGRFLLFARLDGGMEAWEEHVRIDKDEVSREALSSADSIVTTFPRTYVLILLATSPLLFLTCEREGKRKEAI
jgi:hypothetical protein